jgi:hypothetical protein
MKTLLEAKEYINTNMDKGCYCPCCNQNVKLYKRPVNATMALILINLSKISLSEFVHASKLYEGFGHLGGDFPKLKHWQLIEEMPNDDNTKKNSGSWRITDKGVGFLLGDVKIPKYIITYNNECLGFSGEEIDINVALGEKFNYSELMAL